MASKRRSCGCKLCERSAAERGWQFMGQCECSILEKRKRGQEQKKELALERALDEKKDNTARLLQEVARCRPDLRRPISELGTELQAKLYEFVGEPDLLDLL